MREVDAVVGVVIGLLGGGYCVDAIGVITPYAGQATLIQSRLGESASNADANRVQVNTVDSFQGREKELIVLSCVRANREGKCGFLSDPRRANVSLTRARAGVIVVANTRTLAQDDRVWATWLAWAKREGLVCGAASSGGQSHNQLPGAVPPSNSAEFIMEEYHAEEPEVEVAAEGDGEEVQQVQEAQDVQEVQECKEDNASTQAARQECKERKKRERKEQQERERKQQKERERKQQKERREQQEREEREREERKAEKKKRKKLVREAAAAAAKETEATEPKPTTEAQESKKKRKEADGVHEEQTANKAAKAAKRERMRAKRELQAGSASTVAQM